MFNIFTCTEREGKVAFCVARYMLARRAQLLSKICQLQMKNNVEDRQLQMKNNVEILSNPSF